MELRAVIETLKYFENPSDIVIVSDSQYVLAGIDHIEAYLQDLNRTNYDLWFDLAEELKRHSVKTH